MLRRNRKSLARAVILCAAAAAAGCAGNQAFRQGKADEALEQWDKAVVDYSRARQQNPTDDKYKIAFNRARIKASQDHFQKGKMYLSSGRPELAVVELEQTVTLDPTNDYAANELRHAREQAARLEAERSQPTQMQRLKLETQNAQAIGPILQPTSKKPISLNFPQARPIKQIYQALAQASGINVIFDPALKDDPASIVLTSVSFQNALETLIRQENHFYKTVDSHTILIAADTPANRKTYEDLVIRTFYLSNGDITETANAIRALLGTVHVSTNKAENAITIRDTADKVAIAQRVINQNDKAKAEVVVDVELLQIDTGKANTIGLVLPNQVSATYNSSGTTGATGSTGATSPTLITWDALKHLAVSQFGFGLSGALPSVTLDLLKTATDAKVLAKPQMRISEGENSELSIGQKFPIPSTTFNTQTALGTGSILPVTSFQYQDIGIKIKMEPRVHHNHEVTLKLTVDVTSLGGTPTGPAGAAGQPIIDNRTISSTIRLKDGETNLIAGLYRQDKSSTDSGVSFLSDIPILGRLFTHTAVTNNTTDLVMTITPHIVRVPDITIEDLVPVFVGTENNVSYQGGPKVESFNGQPGPFDQQQSAKPRPTPNSRQQTPANPGGINLAPSAGPSNPFAPPKASQIPPSSTQPGNSQSQAEGYVPLDDSAPSDAFGFAPATVTLTEGKEEQTILTLSGGGDLGSTSLLLTVDSNVAQIVSIDAFGGTEASVISGSSAMLSFPLGFSAVQSQPLARIVLRGISPGTCALTVDSSLNSAASPAGPGLAQAFVVVQ